MARTQYVYRQPRQSPYTPPRTPTNNRALAPRNAIGWITAAAPLAAGVAGESYRYVRDRLTRAKPKRIVRSLGHGYRRKFKKRKVNVIGMTKMKGVSKKFAKKVSKVINHKLNWGEYTFLGCRQLRQATYDAYGLVNTDEKGIRITLGTPLELRDAASVLWNSKPMRSDYFDGTGNYDKEIPITCLWESMIMNFKSTSSHVVNVEVFECTFKENCDFSAYDLAASSFDDYTVEAKVDTAGTFIPTLATLGVKARHMTSLNNVCRVKVHTVKLNPGEISSLKFMVRKNYTLDGSQNIVETGQTSQYTKGSKEFFFRVLNDATVSKDLSERIHFWPSNEIGGVAMTFQKVLRMSPPDAVSNIGRHNVVKIFRSMNFKSTETDQQVSYSTNGSD